MTELTEEEAKSVRTRPPAPPPPPPLPKKSPTAKAPPRPPRNASASTVPIDLAIEKVMATTASAAEESEVVRVENIIKAVEAPPSEDSPSSSSDRNPIAPTPLAASAGSSRYVRVSEASPRSSPTGESLSLTASGRAAETSPRLPPGTKSSFFLSPSALGKGDSSNEIYHKSQFSEFWMAIFQLLLVAQFVLLLTAASDALPLASLVVIVLLIFSSLICVIYARSHVTKSYLSASRNVRLRNGVCTPEDEADGVPDSAVYCLGIASICLGSSYAIFTAVLAGSADINGRGFFTQDTLLQTLRFSSITLLALHRVLRPANRIDPLRTIMDLEVVAVCWDAIDGSTLYDLLDQARTDSYSTSLQSALRFLMAFWYFSVGLRMAIMIFTHLSPLRNGFLLCSPFQLAPQPTVDRTLQALRLRAIVVMTMAFADFFAGALRIYMWSRGYLDALQQDMAIKNLIFLITCSGAYSMYTNTITRNWNNRELLTFPCRVRKPARVRQLYYLRILFVITHLTLASLLTYVLVVVDDDALTWITNLAFDIILCVIFLVYANCIYVKADAHDPTHPFIIPRKEFFSFPSKLGISLGFALSLSLFVARIPALYYNYPNLNNYDDDKTSSDGGSTHSLLTYTNAMMLVVLMVVPIACYSSYWSISYMLFRGEFTASPGNYNSIHDPVINMVAISTMTEGALDVLSCATLMQLAENHLPSSVNNAVIVFCLLEMANACQSFALPCTLSGGHDDTPLDLVKWMAFLRSMRCVVDFGAIILRLILWIKYNAVSSVFLVKNIYNLLHTLTQIERYQGVHKYPKGTLFSEFVTPQDWYGMTKEEWRRATSETVAAQARAGRRV